MTRVKTHYIDPESSGFRHRIHRAMKGRKYRPDYWAVKAKKLQLQRKREQELDAELPRLGITQPVLL